MKQLYESEVLFQLMERDGFNIPSSVPPYESEIKAYLINQVKQAYPKLTDYEAEWLLYNYTKHLPAEFPISTVENTTYAQFENVVPFAYQSAILSGNTLVNVINYDNGMPMTGVNLIKDDDTITVTSQKAVEWLRASYSLNVSYDKTYIVTWDSLTYTHTDSRGEYQLIGVYGYDENGAQYSVKATSQNQTNKYLIFTIPSSSNINISTVQIRIHATTGVAEAGVTTTIKGLKIIEYQEGMENWNIPYFEGMQSVKMPALTTTGKNMFDSNNTRDGYGFSGANVVVKDTWFISDYIEVKPNLSYMISASNYGVIGRRINFYDKNKNFVESGVCEDNIIPVPNNNTIFYMRTNAELSIKSSYQIEQGTVATPYEPYKSNILTVNDDVTLRGIGEVRDTLDCLTGEVTERIGEIVLDGSETKWVLNAKVEGYTRANIANIAKNDVANNNTKIKTMSDTLPSIAFNDMYTGDGIGIATNEYGNLYIRLKTSDLISDDINGIKDYLSKNNVTVHYLLNTESVKTVDLTTLNESGETVHFMPLEGIMNVSTSSETIQPTFDMSVPVEATTQNLASFIDMEMEE